MSGRSVAVTRARSQASTLVRDLVSLGAEVVEVPVIAIEAGELSEREVDCVRRAAEFDWIVFTSQNGVSSFVEWRARCAAESDDPVPAKSARVPPKPRPGTAREDCEFGDVSPVPLKKLAAVGNATAAALRAHGFEVELVPDTFTAAGLLEMFERLSPAERGRTALLPRADIATRELPDGLARLGLAVSEVSIYRTVAARPPEDTVERLAMGGVDFVTFTSASTATNLAIALGRRRFVELSERSCFASIGPVTSARLRELGATIGVEAQQSNIAGLIRAIVSALE